MGQYVNDYTRTVKTYYNELTKYKVLSIEDERRLIHEAKNCNICARNVVIQSHLKYVFSVAKRYKGYGVPLEDLISEGNLALFKALEMFDETRGVKFISCAIWWIKAAIKKRIQGRGEQQQHELPTDQQQNTEKRNTYNEDDDEPDNIINEHLISYEDCEFDKSPMLHKVAHNLLEKLDDNGKFIVKASFGIDMSKMTLGEIGDIMHISKERVRKIRDANLRILRSNALMLKEIDDIY